VPIVTEPPLVGVDEPREAAPDRTPRPAAAPCIEIRVAGAVVRVPVGTDGALLMEVLRAVRASAA
jgi:transposase